MRAYWFSRDDGTTQYQLTPAAVGRTDTCQGELVPCENGLHASPTPWDALKYASGPLLWEVELSDERVEHGGGDGPAVDKFAARSRTYLRCIDLTVTLRAFAAKQALTVLHLWSPPDVVREYLTDTAAGKDRSDIMAAARAAARAAAWDAARAAAMAAARAAARAAAWDAAWDAAWAAAWDAAWAAAWDAARAAAWDAAWDAARKQFNELALAALEGAE